MANLHAPGWIAAAIREGLSANQALRDYRSAGGAMGRSTWLKLYAEQRATVNATHGETTKPLNAIPNAEDIIPMTTKRASGYLQTVEVYTRLTGTDVVTTRPYMISGDSLITRGEAITTALTSMQTAVDGGRYEEVILGAVYTGTRSMTPGVLQ